MNVMEEQRFEGRSPELALVRGQLRVSFEALGESLYGDEVDEEDLGDVEVLRFCVERPDPENTFHPWETIDDSSYCTQIRADSEDTELRRLLLVIMDAVYQQATSDQSIKRICEELSWLPERFGERV